MTWNHRVVELRDGDDTVLVICEVFYDEQGVPKMRNDGAKITGSTFAELADDIARISKALKMPRLTEEHFSPGKT